VCFVKFALKGFVQLSVLFPDQVELEFVDGFKGSSDGLIHHLPEANSFV
jgi:hypothetical protein